MPEALMPDCLRRYDDAATRRGALHAPPFTRKAMTQALWKQCGAERLLTWLPIIAPYFLRYMLSFISRYVIRFIFSAPFDAAISPLFTLLRYAHCYDTP